MSLEILAIQEDPARRKIIIMSKRMSNTEDSVLLSAGNFKNVGICWPNRILQPEIPSLAQDIFSNCSSLYQQENLAKIGLELNQFDKRSDK